ncbi:MAG: DEAD/DEAH box helicase [Anaerolineales bacterium]|nr:DEAD/DEAH box helicase [Anaerolineales bacterium]
MNPLSALFDFWKEDPDTAPNFFAWRTTPARAAQTHPFPTDLPDALRETLSTRGIHSLYSHQLSAWTETRAGKNIILATGTASGKTLSYNLPVLAAMLHNHEARALYLFPTKALAQGSVNHVGKFKGFNVSTFQPSNSYLRRRHSSSQPPIHSQECPHHFEQSRYAAHGYSSAPLQLGRLLFQPQIHRH